MWIEFGRINNLKCVDYFRVTYTKSDKTGVTTITTDPIDRLEKGALMTVVPCTLYTFRVAAYEEFHGTGRRFKMLSNEVNKTTLYCTVLCTVQVNFTLDYTPKFVKKPIVWEKKASLLSNARQRQLPSREKRGIFRVNRALSTLLSPDCTCSCFRGPPPRSGPRPSPSSPSRSCGTLATSTSPSAWTGDLALALAS